MTVTLISEASGSEGLALIPFAIMMIGLIVIVASMFVSPYQDTFFAIVCGGGSILAMGWFIGALGIFSSTPAEYEISGTVSTINLIFSEKPRAAGIRRCLRRRRRLPAFSRTFRRYQDGRLQQVRGHVDRLHDGLIRHLSLHIGRAREVESPAFRTLCRHKRRKESSTWIVYRFSFNKSRPPSVLSVAPEPVDRGREETLSASTCQAATLMPLAHARTSLSKQKVHRPPSPTGFLGREWIKDVSRLPSDTVVRRRSAATERQVSSLMTHASCSSSTTPASTSSTVKNP